MIHLQNYFNRINYQGSTTPELATLKAIHALHPAHIPFENIDVLLDRGISLELDSIQQKLIGHRRGGYCFEHNALFMEVLQQLGFEVESLMARTVWRQPDNTPLGPRTHQVLRVRIDGEWWLADVGFGGMVLTDPIRLETDEEQQGQHEAFRFKAHEHGWLLQVNIQEEWQDLYDIGNQPQEPIDMDVANWFTSASPNSKFRHNLMMARATPDTRYALLNNRLTVRPRNGTAEQRELTPEQLAAALEECFELTVEREWIPLLERIVEKGNLSS
ncbi:arylamine N-acetyltransferase [Marinomonas piezotolerans]|uniref:Arylamine N-acetyltransferase n=1 Tax=Marinomonas piezotolerans TaxID=2213058 RepID=A0A370UC45_9GAMM|nr:arylamine N-acetyltransferase [Marinomonas piezotolerans]RDL45319.1 arylamine N-acetyltransferase [Marinomonas piezotolerans]